MDVIKTYSPTKSILGVCLGVQAIAEVFGGSLYNLSYPVHGRATAMQVLDKDEILFDELPQTYNVGRYHSWAVSREDLPEELIITAKDTEGVIMGLRHKQYDVRGVQFHPESVLTENGKQMISNWLNNPAK